jgi:hypothetical protein
MCTLSIVNLVSDFWLGEAAVAGSPGLGVGSVSCFHSGKQLEKGVWLRIQFFSPVIGTGKAHQVMAQRNLPKVIL